MDRVYRDIHTAPPEEMVTLTNMDGEPICSMTRDHVSWMITQGYMESDDDQWNLTETGKTYILGLHKLAVN